MIELVEEEYPLVVCMAQAIKLPPWYCQHSFKINGGSEAVTRSTDQRVIPD